MLYWVEKNVSGFYLFHGYSRTYGVTNMQSGVVFEFKEFAVQDGPGARLTVFFKGCPLRCQWCHNPEGLSSAPQLMVSRQSCLQCGACQSVCHAQKENTSCDLCGACVRVCPLGLRKIAGQRYTSQELIRIIRRDSDYYRALDGGVTFSGGEPLMQPAFLSEVLDGLQDIHTAIETCGYAPSETFLSIVPRMSFVMMDLKLMDPAAHRHYTGVDNEPILRNLRSLCEGDTPFVVRIPLIPGVNDTKENLIASARFLQGARSLQRVELLPYHLTAGAKYSMLGKEYSPDFDPAQPVRTYTDLFEQYDIRSVVL